MQKAQVEMWRFRGFTLDVDWETLSDILYLTGKWRFVDDEIEIQVCEYRLGWMSGVRQLMWKGENAFRFIEEFDCRGDNE